MIADNSPTILIVGASRGLGHAMAEEFVTRGWNVIGTVRIGNRTQLHELAEQHRDRVRMEIVDINVDEQIEACARAWQANGWTCCSSTQASRRTIRWRGSAR